MLRLAKISSFIAVVLDLETPGSTDFVEYDPTKPDDKWGGNLKLIGSNKIEITVGPYVLTATEASPGRFSGVENGPHGSAEFDVVVLDTNPDSLFEPVPANWLCFAAGSYKPYIDNPMTPLIQNAPEQRRGVSVFRLGPDMNGGILVTARGVRESESFDALVSQFPSRSDRNPSLHVDYALPGPKYRFGLGETQDFVPDRARCCYRSTSGIARCIYPSGDLDLIEALKKHRK